MRWTAKRKAVIVHAVVNHHLSVKDACEEFDISPAELDEWLDRFFNGEPLRATYQIERMVSYDETL